MLSIDVMNVWLAVGFLAILAALVAALIVVNKSIRLRRSEGVDRAEVKAEWQKIMKLLDLHWQKEMNSKLAVVAADKLLDDVLTKIGFSGGDPSERLKIASYRYQRLRKVRWAHEVRKQIDRNPNYVLKYGEARFVLKLIRTALRELGAI
ncbi:MAG: hypothetical protein V1763_03190 [Parcubacteria group bacterium]